MKLLRAATVLFLVAANIPLALCDWPDKIFFHRSCSVDQSNKMLAAIRHGIKTIEVTKKALDSGDMDIYNMLMGGDPWPAANQPPSYAKNVIDETLSMERYFGGTYTGQKVADDPSSEEVDIWPTSSLHIECNHKPCKWAWMRGYAHDWSTGNKIAIPDSHNGITVSKWINNNIPYTIWTVCDGFLDMPLDRPGYCPTRAEFPLIGNCSASPQSVKVGADFAVGWFAEDHKCDWSYSEWLIGFYHAKYFDVRVWETMTSIMLETIVGMYVPEVIFRPKYDLKSLPARRMEAVDEHRKHYLTLLSHVQYGFGSKQKWGNVVTPPGYAAMFNAYYNNCTLPKVNLLLDCHHYGSWPLCMKPYGPNYNPERQVYVNEDCKNCVNDFWGRWGEMKMDHEHDTAPGQVKPSRFPTYDKIEAKIVSWFS